jgi:hypothetical protein
LIGILLTVFLPMYDVISKVGSVGR